MLKKTAIALGLAMTAGTALAASNGSMGAGVSGSMNNGGMSTGATQDSSLAAEFRSLDTNHDGVLSRSEASANPQVRSVYSSLDTNDTIQEPGKNGGMGGITMDQFQAGMQAASHGGGVVGPAVSGGGTYIMMKDGSQRRATGGSGSGMNSGGGAGMSNGASMSGGSSGMNSSMQSTTGNRMQRGAGNTTQRINSGVSNGYDRMRSQGSSDYGSSRSQMNSGGQSMQPYGSQTSGGAHMGASGQAGAGAGASANGMGTMQSGDLQSNY